MAKFEPECLKELFVGYHDRRRYLQLAAENEGRVVQWRSASGDMLKAQPFEHECFHNEARWLEDGELPEVREVSHGLNAEGRIIVAREVWSLGCSAEEDLEETQYLYEGPRITGITARANRKPKDFVVECVEQFTYKARRLVSYRRFNWNCASMDTFHWTKGQLECSAHCSSNHVEFFYPNDPDNREWKGTKIAYCLQRTYEYNEQDQIERVWEHTLDAGGIAEEGPQRLVYLRPMEGQTIGTLSAEIEKLLLEAIPPAVQRAKVKSPAYCLLLCYCGEDYEAGWPPFLVVGSEKERRRILKQGDDVAYYLWAPDEMRDKPDNREISLDDPALSAKCHVHLQLMSVKGNYTSVRKVLKNVAQGLSAFRWKGLLPATKDFIVAFVDNTGERPFKKDIKASITEERFAELTSRGLL